MFILIRYTNVIHKITIITFIQKITQDICFIYKYTEWYLKTINIWNFLIFLKKSSTFLFLFLFLYYFYFKKLIFKRIIKKKYKCLVLSRIIIYILRMIRVACVILWIKELKFIFCITLAYLTNINVSIYTNIQCINKR